MDVCDCIELDSIWLYGASWGLDEISIVLRE
jgi:hypothetical protein